MKYALVRYDPVRAVLATAGLALAGGVFGGFAGTLSLAIVMVLASNVATSFGWFALGLAGAVGAALGVISAPLVIWVMLRRMPLGRAFAWLTASTAFGGILGWFALSWLDVVIGPTLVAFIAFVATAIVLSFRYERAPVLTRN